jgi:hypothetical protein
MGMRLFSIALVACGAYLFAVPELPVPAERPDAAVQTDFDALHAQANLALENLRQSGERRMASATAAAF